MTPQITILIDACYALSVAAAAMLFPPAALVVAAAFLLGQAILADRRTKVEG